MSLICKLIQTEKRDGILHLLCIHLIQILHLIALISSDVYGVRSHSIGVDYYCGEVHIER